MMELLSYPFLQRALVAGILIGFLCAFLGVFVVLRKMAFFGDAVAHSSFTGIALGFLLGINPSLSALLFAILVAVLMVYFKKHITLALDTLIGVFYATTAGLGILMIGLLQGYRVDLFQYLFGDILAVSNDEIFFILAIALVALVFLVYYRSAWTQILFNQELAQINGVNIVAMEYLLMILLAVTVAVSIKAVGIILVISMLIIPAAAAKNIATSLKGMVILSTIFGILSALFGLLLSYSFNTASGATMILTSVVFFIGSTLYRSAFLSSGR